MSNKVKYSVCVVIECYVEVDALLDDEHEKEVEAATTLAEAEVDKLDALLKANGWTAGDPEIELTEDDEDGDDGDDDSEEDEDDEDDEDEE